MKPAFPRFASLPILFALVVVIIPVHGGLISNPSNILQAATPTDTPTNLPGLTSTSIPTDTPTSTPSGSFVRPQIAVQTYRTNPSNVQYGQNFKLFVKLRNAGQVSAFNVQVSFTSSNLLPLQNGGVVIAGDLVAGNSIDVEQPMTAATYLYGIVSVDMNLSYYDVNGAT